MGVRGRKKQYSDGLNRTTFTCPPELWRMFIEEWALRGVINQSQAIQQAMRLWLAVEGGKRDAMHLEVPMGDGIGDTHVRLPSRMYKAIAAHAAKGARTVPAVCREALAEYIRRRADLPEFQGVGEWQLLPKPEVSDRLIEGEVKQAAPPGAAQAPASG